jgi:hypothetical protein
MLKQKKAKQVVELVTGFLKQDLRYAIHSVLFPLSRYVLCMAFGKQ